MLHTLSLTHPNEVPKKGGHVPKLIEMDPNVTIFEQMNDTGGTVVLINKFNVILKRSINF